MLRSIVHIVEPVRLLLIWQAIATKERRRYVVGDLRRTDDVVQLSYAIDSADFAQSQAEGFVGYPAFPNARRSYSAGVLEAFLRRIPPSSRSDFPDYLRQFRLPVPWRHSQFALLGYTAASLPSDGFSLVHTFEDYSGPFEFLTEVAGVSHSAGAQADLGIGAQVLPRLDTQNPYDSNAVEWICEGKRIGYAPRGLSRALSGWLNEGRAVEANIDHIRFIQGRLAIRLFMQASGLR